MEQFHTIIVGAGAAGLFCAATAGQRGRKVLLLDHAKKAGEKIRISGGGRCNFTNLNAAPDKFLSGNPHFCVSALKRYTQWDFIDMVQNHGIAYHEKTLGQLFCDGSSQQIINMLLKECRNGSVEIRLEHSVMNVEKTDTGFLLQTNLGRLASESLVIATGGKSIPKMGATGFGYDIASQFGLDVVDTRAGLVPLRFGEDLLDQTNGLSGVATEAVASCNKKSFREALLFTHRGLSGPVILQISSYWRPGEAITINLAPDIDMFQRFKIAKESNPKQSPQTILAETLPKRLAQKFAEMHNCSQVLAETPDKKLRALAGQVNDWSIKPCGDEGYRTAEVTLGGVDTKELSSKTFESRKIPGLFFIGEVVDVTGHLGGYNFQWAWSSGHCAGQFI
ncbi:NAD(P)/FAD-dependent oxidoreductase [Aestuariispira insulae]|uniref:Aminoacetone oxidase family FAD-binding enzyme n=1 Tax=Aestuariispira insulae TaxID=1461337 RepID=A0A3D9HPG3_9PROT|nr:NAD(P)/FAD-dependent oxidoreductase [Aestuariispira insulae]RED50786.1 hypothetical protein DFP90_10458 [Aestuariispira insulae]